MQKSAAHYTSSQLYPELEEATEMVWLSRLTSSQLRCDSLNKLPIQSYKIDNWIEIKWKELTGEYVRVSTKAQPSKV